MAPFLKTLEVIITFSNGGSWLFSHFCLLLIIQSYIATTINSKNKKLLIYIYFFVLNKSSMFGGHTLRWNILDIKE
jgi:hypothetical protein